MTNYTDEKQRSWNIYIDVNTLKNIRKKVTDSEGKSVDLMEIVSGNLIIRLLNDPVLLVDILAVLCADQIVAMKITADDFAAAQSGDALENALEALMEAFKNFCRKSERENITQRYTMALRLRAAGVKMMLETEANTEKIIKAQTPEEIQRKINEAAQMAAFQEIQKIQPNAGN